jgi:hypothetical protein
MSCYVLFTYLGAIFFTDLWDFFCVSASTTHILACEICIMTH